MNYKYLFTSYLDQKGVRYTELDDFTVRVSYTGDNMSTIPAIFGFDKDGDGLVTVHVWSIAKIPDAKMASALIACNDLNKKYRWVRFYIDSDQEFTTNLDAYIDDVTCGEECFNLLTRIINITDEAYPRLMQAIYS